MQSSIVSLSILMALILTLGSPALAQEKDRPAGRIAVVDMELIFRNYEKSIRYDEELAKLQREHRQGVLNREKEIKVVEDEISELEPGTGRHMDRQIAWSKLKVTLEYWKKTQGEEIAKKLVKFTDEVEQDLRNAAAKVAKRKGFDIVINFDPPTLDEAKSFRGRRIPVVLYADRAVDLTDAVLAELNPPAGGGQQAGSPSPKSSGRESPKGEGE
ncbi:MAG: OmpH family outer membrane protein [Planctomycetota bacterium]|nr:OmpH family outer membrane protein [Planctomycetota bacterium]